jgi:3-hydroxy acid dehydrogenase/malonic semialdehyde reductase
VAEYAISGKTAIVTGASSGIGRATAKALADRGVRVAGGARRVDRLETEIALELDVRDRESSERFVQAAVEQLGGIDILFNNAGLALGRYPFDESNEEDESTIFDTNVSGLVRMTRLCLPHIRDGGHIVNMGSVAGRQAYENAASYVASKFAVRGFHYALREDLLGRPIRLTTVDGGLVETEFSIVRFKGDAEKAAAVYKGIDPLRAEDIADCVLWAVTRPWHMNVDEIVVKARNQASGGRIFRET